METLLESQDLNRSFMTSGDKLQVLTGINLKLFNGEKAAVMGPSGAGKSTLLHILGALDRPTSGTVLCEGRDIFSMGSEGLAVFRNKTIGFVFQFHHLLPEFNALENTMMPALIAGIDRRDAGKMADRVLGEVGLSHRLKHRPGELSGGEQQRVAVARALILKPKIIFADEPTGNLDTKTGEELFNLLIDLNKKGMTILMVTHNESLASRCDRIIKMLDGRLV